MFCQKKREQFNEGRHFIFGLDKFLDFILNDYPQAETSVVKSYLDKSELFHDLCFY